MADSPTVAGLLRERAGEDHPALLFEDRRWSWAEFVRECAARAELALALRRGGRPFHIGVLLENVPDYLFWIGAAAFSGATVVGINPTRRGAELAADIRHTDCDLIITADGLAGLLDGLDLGVEPDRVLNIDAPAYANLLARHDGAAIPDAPAADDPATTLLLLFTSGSTGRPKAVICSTGRLARIAVLNWYGIRPDDVSYNAMPLFHGNAIMACWASALSTGSTFAMRRRFSASGFLPDLRRFQATYFNYVGRSLAYILAQPEHPGERENRVRFCFGTEASAYDRSEFERRFACRVVEGYGSSEGPVSIGRTPDTPPDALGPAPPGFDLTVIDPATGEECPRARFDAHHRLLNAGEAIGELVHRQGAQLFEGYYNDPEADEQRVRGDWFLTGDLVYRDEEGFFYFAGRAGDRLRVDSENFSAAPVETILCRFPGVALAAVYPVPDPRTGDQVMVTLQLADGASFDPAAFAAFLTGQRDMGPKWVPRFVRIAETVPVTATRKIDKAPLRRQRWNPAPIEGPVYWREGTTLDYRPLTPRDILTLEKQFDSHGRRSTLDTGE